MTVLLVGSDRGRARWRGVLLPLGVGVSEAPYGRSAARRAGTDRARVAVVVVEGTGEAVARTLRLLGQARPGLVRVAVVRGPVVPPGLIRRLARAGVEDVVVVPPWGGGSVVRRAVETAWAQAGEPGEGPLPPGEVIVVLGPRGGVGKTAVAVTVAALCREARPQETTVLLDLDPALMDVARWLDLPGEGGHGPDGLLLVPGQPDREDGGMAALPDWDVLVVDTPVGPTPAVRAWLSCATRVLLVTAPEVLALARTRALCQRLGEDERVWLVLNRPWRSGGLRAAEVARLLDRSVRVDLPHDPAVPQALLRGVPPPRASPRSPFVRALRRLITDLLAP